MEVKTLISGILTVISRCIAVAHTYEITGDPVITFPSDIPANTTTISAHRVNMSIFPEDAFNHFFQLEELKFHHNPLATMPNLIPVGNTLKNLNIVNSDLTELNATVYNELRVLETLNVRRSPIASFPDVPNGPRESLTSLVLQECQLTSFIRVAQYAKLESIRLNQNPIVGAIEEEDLMGVLNLQSLQVAKTGVTSLPESPKLLEQLTTLDIADTDVTVVPVTCPRSDLTVLAEQSSVSVCECDNVWLAALHGQRGSVSLDDMSCEGTNSTQELLQARCEGHFQPGDIRSSHMTLKYSGYFCEFPVYSLSTDISKLDCFRLCVDTLGCSSFGFRSTSGELGSCAIIAPTDSALTDIPDAGSPGWNYYAVKKTASSLRTPNSLG